MGALAANSQFVDFEPVPPSRVGQFVVPVNPLAPAKFYRLLLEDWPSPLINFPDFSVIIPADEISIIGTGASREFRYTHDTFNGGAGPLEILPVYSPASGNYQGYQHLYHYPIRHMDARSDRAGGRGFRLSRRARAFPLSVCELRSLRG